MNETLSSGKAPLCWHGESLPNGRETEIQTKGDAFITHLNTRKTVQICILSVIALSVAQKGSAVARARSSNTTQHISDSSTKIADITAIIEALRFRPTFSR
ncbi:hypothetical protein OKW46_003237 [Paraburkholderia sp. WSM4179]|nr:hypothetical protein [Paraburkholderia sp. WSM4179]